LRETAAAGLAYRTMQPSDRTHANAARAQAAFPSLLIHPDRFEARGAFAQAQAAYLDPDPDAVATLTALLSATHAGVVAHFYMDAELQGTLAACAWPDIHIADSLQMAERAVHMAEQGAKAIVVLGVDFMSENVRATLDASGFAHVPVYRVARDPIGCSLAESAETRAYAAYLAHAARTPCSLHVIYVNTSLRIKARAQTLLPTITCTSSNVLRLLLQAYAQVPDLHVWFGPDTYMGRNLASMLEALSRLDPAAVHQLHPGHTPASLGSARERFGYFEQGVCIVHHMFGEAVVAQVRRDYADAFVTAHLEVPGEMFALGFQAQREGRGVVGSTSNILDFIDRKVSDAVIALEPARLRFILGTESGMITPVARRVQQKLRALRDAGGPELAVEIVFPVAAEAIAATADPRLPIVPGVAGGEGCSAVGGCATCPYMKMNSLDALTDLLRALGSADPSALAPYTPKTYAERIGGHSVAALAGKSIARMRSLQREGVLPAELVAELHRGTSSRAGG
jgi:quinolinate synthase